VPAGPDAGHFVAEEAPDAMLAALTEFLGAYRDGLVEAHDARAHAAGDRAALRAGGLLVGTKGET
jgi:hypothetical protein